MSIKIAGELVALAERQERLRFRRALKKEFDFLHSKLWPGPVCSRDIIEAFERLEAVAPLEKKTKKRAA